VKLWKIIPKSLYISSAESSVMGRFTIFLSIVVLIAAIVLLFMKLFTPATIQITLASGQEITATSPEYFSIVEVLLMVVCAFLIGSASIYLYYNADVLKQANGQPKTTPYDSIMPLLKAEEKKVVLALIEAKGEMLQNKLVAKLNLSKVKVTRVLHHLQQKNLIIKERHGLTNNVKLAK
jgi:uncharacterized membrane protein